MNVMVVAMDCEGDAGTIAAAFWLPSLDLLKSLPSTHPQTLIRKDTILNQIIMKTKAKRRQYNMKNVCGHSRNLGALLPAAASKITKNF